MAELPLVKLDDEEEELPLVELPLVNLDEEPKKPKKFQPYQDEKGNWIKGESNQTDDIQGFGNTLLNAQAMGGGDEVVGFTRALLPDPAYDFGENVSMEKQPFLEKAKMYQQEAEQSKKDFAEENPVGSITTEVLGGAANPLNKLKLASRGKGFLPRAVETIARGGAEGAATGFLENNEDRMAGLETGAKWGGGISAGLAGLGGLGQAASNERVKEQLVKWVDDGKGGMKRVFQPLNLADPESRLGKFYRNVVGVSYGGGKIGDQESRYFNQSPEFQKFVDPETGTVVPETFGTKNAIRDAQERVKNKALTENIDIDARIDETIRDIDKTKDYTTRATDDYIQEQSSVLKKAREQSSIAQETAKDSANKLAVQQTVETSLPEAMPNEIKDKIRSIADPVDQEKMITKWWNKNAYKGIKDAEFKWDGGLRDEIESALPDMPAPQRAELENIIDRIDRATDRASPSGINVVNEGSAILDASGKPINPPSISEIETIDGDTLLEVRNFFARNANKVRSQKGKANRLVADYFDDQFKKQLGEDSEAYQQLLDFNKRYNAKLALEKSARSARKAGRDIKASDITSKASDKSALQESVLDKKKAGDRVAEQEKQRLSQAVQQIEDKKIAARKQKNAATDRADARKKAANAERKTTKKENLREAADDRKMLERASRGVLAEDPSVGNKAVATAMLGLPLGVLTGGYTTPAAGVATARALASETGQRAMAGQLDIQKALAAALRAGDLEKYTRLLSRQAALQATGE